MPLWFAHYVICGLTEQEVVNPEEFIKNVVSDDIANSDPKNKKTAQEIHKEFAPIISAYRSKAKGVKHG